MGINVAVALLTLAVACIIIVAGTSSRLLKNAEGEMFEKANIISRVISVDMGGDYAAYINDSLMGTGIRGILLDESAAAMYDTETDGVRRGTVFTNSLITSSFLGNQESMHAKTNSGTETLSVCVPIYSDESICGALYLTRQLSEEKKIIDFLKFGFLSLAFVLAAVVGALSILQSRTVSVPMTDFIDAAQEISKGNFDRRIPIKGNKDLDRLAESMNYMCAELEHLENKRRKFVSDASHELKTPMATIKLVCDSITATENPDIAMVSEFLTDLSEEVDRLTRIIEKLLLLTKLDSGEAQFTPELVDFGMMLQRIKNKLTPMAVSKNITVSLDVPEDMMPMMLDYDRIWEAVYNVADNAIKYSKIGGIVKIRCICGDDIAELEVIDSGKGIPDEYKERIFERFYRLDDSRARETGGTGLGLSIAKESVLLHGGELFVVDNDDGGSKFVIKLPINHEKKQENVI